ncbi:GntR family transcriptional regulator [Variovorax sp. J22G73]|jgi:DNA-binding GntR family transcriptional regulator|uniref:GntR family transcriptional regulator n=1 Tax=unclassified Variovorax TaxID=663243 RepID=UPI000D5CBA46|nr:MULTISPECIES: GntR family transcriptional regulator [unclassified Variovorax]MDM0006170.1 GntR family transcriptional regulator [Variovorax sp. J22R203]MDM0097807.1 GntR family transcriptional regulator [Variovorax sp. J22G73]
MNEKTKGPSQTRQVFAELRTAIVGGRLLPGSKLNIAALAEELDVSAGAVREGLAMLEAESLVVSEPSRGYRVSPISPEDLEELVKARIEIEKLCLAEAIRHGDLAWEGSVVSAHHRLSRQAERDAAMPTVLSAEWTSSHADFHNALVSGCPNSWLLRMHQMLYQQSERYRQLSAPLGKESRDVGAEHQALLDAVLNRDIQAAQVLMAEHLQTTGRLLMSALRASVPAER